MITPFEAARIRRAIRILGSIKLHVLNGHCSPMGYIASLDEWLIWYATWETIDKLSKSFSVPRRHLTSV